jgi:predicted metal-binding protein
MGVKDGGRLFICRTCVRDLRVPPGEKTAGEKLYEAVEAAVAKSGADVPLRGTACLNGCPSPCNASVRGHGKALIRFSRLTPEDAPALIAMARAYLRHKTGELSAKELPETLRAKVSARAPVLGPVRG